MLDAPLRQMLERPLERVGRMAAAHVTANQVTVAGFACGMAAAVLVAVDLAAVGLALFVLNRMADGLDGAVARVRGATALGGFLDVALDLIVYAAVAFAFAIREPTAEIAVSFFLLGFASMMMTELSLRFFARTEPAQAPLKTSDQVVEAVLTELDAALKRADKLDLRAMGTFKVKTNDQRRLDAPLIGHTETFAVLAIACAYPPVFPTLAYLYGAMCFVACGFRIVSAMDQLKGAES